METRQGRAGGGSAVQSLAMPRQPARARREPELKFTLGLLTGVQGAGKFAHEMQRSEKCLHAVRKEFRNGLLKRLKTVRKVYTLAAFLE